MYKCDNCGFEFEREEIFLDKDGRKLCACCFAQEHYDDLEDFCDDYIRDVAREMFVEETDRYDFECLGYNYYASGVRSARCEEDYEDLFDEYISEVRGDIDLSDHYTEFAEEYSLGHPEEEQC